MAIIILAIATVSGCIGRESKTHIFFCGDVVMKYNPRSAGKGDDQFIITFCEVGNYTIRFTPDKFNSCCDCDNEYIITDDDIDCCNNYEIILTTWKLPTDLTVRIERNGESECYTF